ncbi:Bgt-51198 [Blumeria graminis f. sp. tritici]|nr:Bgt-51198 [Blumeria graminis f. sp. tritici]
MHVTTNSVLSFTSVVT